MELHTSVCRFKEAKEMDPYIRFSRNFAVFNLRDLGSKGHTTIRKFSSVDNFHSHNSLIQTFDEKTKKFKNIFPLIYDVSNLRDAWHEIKSKPGNLTSKGNNKTLDGLPLVWFTNISDKLKHGTHKYAPSRKVGIPKPGKTETKYLTIGSPRDKVIQKAFLRILEQIYEGLSE